MLKTQEKTETAGPVIPAAESQQSVSRTARRLMDVKLQVRVLFGRATLPLKEILQLTSGSLVELDEQPDAEVELVVDEKVIARGQVVVVDGCYGVKITSIVTPGEIAAGTLAPDLANLLQNVG